MGKQRRKFEVGFKQQIVNDVASGALSLTAAARQYEVSPSVIKRWCEKASGGGLEVGASAREKTLERENQELKEKLAELYMQVEHLKKMEDYARRRKSATTSVITSTNLAQFRKGAK
jgi:transposase-like protein